METALFEGVLLLFTIARVEGSGKLWGFSDSSQNEKTAKTILESCYPNDSSTELIVIIGDFNELMEESSIVRVNRHVSSPKTNRYSVDNGQISLKVNKIIYALESPEALETDLLLLRRTVLWNHMARFFIVAKNKRTCEDFRRILEVTWKINILNSIYICTDSMDKTILYTMNPMANYAPHPWKRVDQLNDLNVFHQVFDTNISCENLSYDKTKILNDYEIKVVARLFKEQWLPITEGRYNIAFNWLHIDYRILNLLITTWNMTETIYGVMNDVELLRSLDIEESDITLYGTTLTSYRGHPSIFPHQWSQMIAVVKLSPELSTLQKILHMWATPVLIAAGIALLILTLIMTIKNRNLSLAMLDIVRLLIYTSIQTDARSHWFRIYFTTMLIFMVISNGVFQGQIAAFLTKQERAGAVETIDELVKLEYHMYTSGTESFARARCAKCTFKRVDLYSCINYVLNSSRHVCGIEKNDYERNFLLSPLETVKEILNEGFESFKCRRNWPLQERFNNAIMRLVESGIIDFWKMRESHELRQKRREMEAEWSSAQYKPVRLYKLKFAFQMLACGLGLATIVFFFEILWIKLWDFLKHRSSLNE